MINQRVWPFANYYQEGPASCKWSSVTPVTLVNSARIQIQCSGPFENNLFLFCTEYLGKEVDMDVPPQIVLSRRSCISHIVPRWLTCPHPFLYFCRASEVTSLFGEGQKHLDTVSQKKIFYQECFQAGLNLELVVWGWSKVYSKFKTQTTVNIWIWVWHQGKESPKKITLSFRHCPKYPPPGRPPSPRTKFGQN